MTNTTLPDEVLKTDAKGRRGRRKRGAIIYIESCRRRDLDPFAYLREVFTRLPSMTNWQVKNITPEAWAKSRSDLPAVA
jgi:hypothetical protein